MRFFGVYEDPLRTARLFERVFARPLGAVPVDTPVDTAAARRLQVRSLPTRSRRLGASPSAPQRFYRSLVSHTVANDVR